MEKQIKTKGIVIKRINLREADQILTILTQDQGKIALLAKGSRRLKSKFSGKLELFYEVELNYFQGRELAHLNEVESRAYLEEAQLDLKSRSLLFYMAEVTHKLLAEEQECEKVFFLLKEALSYFKKEASEAIFYAYLVKLLTELGFMADWNKCNETNTKLDLEKPYFLSDQDAGPTKNPHLSQFGSPLTPSVIKWINFIQKNEFKLLQKVKPTEKERTEVFVIVKSVMNTILNHPFKSEAFMQLI